MFPTKILLATDGTGEAILAEEAAVEMSSGTGSELHVVHVVSTSIEPPYPQASTRESTEELLERRKLRGLALLEDRTRHLEDLGVTVAASHYREGKPEKEILSLAGQLGVGLIMTGGAKRHGIERIFGPGFSERLSRRASQPVLVVNEEGVLGATVPG